MYRLSMTVKVRQLLASERESLLESRTDEVCDILRSFGCSPTPRRFYFHPDEEAEVRGIEFPGVEIHILRDCKRPQSVVHLSQIVFSLCALFSSEKFSYTAEVEGLSAKDT